MTVCMHLRGFLATTSSMVAELPEDHEKPATIWARWVVRAHRCTCRRFWPPAVFAPTGVSPPTAAIRRCSPQCSPTRRSRQRLAALREEGRSAGHELLESVRGDAIRGFEVLEESVWGESEELLPTFLGAGNRGRGDRWERFLRSIDERLENALDQLETGQSTGQST